MTDARHPLAPLSTEEIDRLREILDAEGLVTAATRFSYIALREPAKADVLAWRPGAALPREVGVLLTDLAADTVTDLVVDLDARAITWRRTLDPAVDGFGPVLDEDFAAADEIVKADAAYVAALAARGITDLSKVVSCPLSAGVFGYDDEVGVRMIRVLSFLQEHPQDSCWAHPIGGLVAHVDLKNRRVVRLIETDAAFVPQESGDYRDPAVRGPERTSLKPISITQPEGVSFTLEDGVLRWENWSVRVGFNGREGLTLHQLSFRDNGVERPVMYRGSIAEMVVNYGDTSPTNAWQNYYDVSEYQFGRLANSLELGCDCLGEITYVDAVVADDLGRPTTLKNAICIHEEDYGILWKHTDFFAGTSEVRRQRRLVVSFFVTVGNYDYGFYWYLYLDGKIELEAKATGIVFTNAHPGGEYEYATEVAPGLGAPIHQHLFSARLDMTVDGLANAVDEVDVARVPKDERNPWGNAFTRTHTRLRTEREGVRDAKGEVDRVWRISSTEKANRLGAPTSYILVPEGKPTLLVDEDAFVRPRAEFAAHHLWVTQYERDELWPAGRSTNQNPGGAGLPAYIAADRPIDGEDIVLWHTFGLTHFPRTEDWPIMPVDYAGFRLLPHGFFDRNPTLDVPNLSTHCAAPAAPSPDVAPTPHGQAGGGGCGGDCRCGH
ncbi:primary-amine oxidase [Microbacterium sp. JZ31]|uniref:primary-amine oxidase n=1 Tax=Microbacterium sp. JZ31 TaxID=1906274 RepID=UPI00193355F7|nr:primary-amine oxidase [Microbacterium sp. JZ31]